MGLQMSKIEYWPRRYVEHYYLCNYRPLHTGSDKLSHSLLRFKNALGFDLKAWIDCTVGELRQLDIPDDVIVIRALGSQETGIDRHANTALDQLGRAMADVLNLRWMPWLIGKSGPTRPLKSLAAKERRAELSHAYCLAGSYFDLNDKRLLLIDDILTTGITITSIIRLVKQSFPRARFKVFTLAKSDYQSRLNRALRLSGPTYQWKQSGGWRVAEPASEYNGYAGLVACILKDDFSFLAREG